MPKRVYFRKKKKVIGKRNEEEEEQSKNEGEISRERLSNQTSIKR